MDFIALALAINRIMLGPGSLSSLTVKRLWPHAANSAWEKILERAMGPHDVDENGQITPLRFG